MMKFGSHPPIAPTEGDVVVAAAGDIACPTARNHLTMPATSRRQPSRNVIKAALVLTLGDAQYTTSQLEAFQNSYDNTGGRFKSRLGVDRQSEHVHPNAWQPSGF
jgi:hypothetical protein